MMEKLLDNYIFSPELSLLLALALRQDTPSIPENWDEATFYTLVDKNRIEPLVAEGLKKLSSEKVQAHPVFGKLLSSRGQYARLCLRQIQALTTVGQAFENRGIRMLSLKGPILAMELYGDPALRFSRDLDLLVCEKDLETACGCLESLGFREEITVFNKTPLRRKLQERDGEEMHRVYAKDDICIELHWRLSFRIDSSFDELWERSRTKILLGQNIHHLGETDELSYLIIHGAGHGYHRLRWLVDIYTLLVKANFPFAETYAYMAEQHVGELLLETILLLYKIPCFSMPPYEGSLFTLRCQNGCVLATYEDTIEKEFEKACMLTEAIYPILISTQDGYGMAGRKYQQLLPTLGRKHTIARLLAELLQPCEADFMLIDLPDSLFFLYYIIRPFYKIWRMLPFSHTEDAL